jgi:hypothetical protein
VCGLTDVSDSEVLDVSEHAEKANSALHVLSVHDYAACAAVGIRDIGKEGIADAVVYADSPKFCGEVHVDLLNGLWF